MLQARGQAMRLSLFLRFLARVIGPVIAKVVTLPNLNLDRNLSCFKSRGGVADRAPLGFNGDRPSKDGGNRGENPERGHQLDRERGQKAPEAV